MGESKPHSKTVRGTLDNPKTKEAMKSDKPIPRLGDPTSLKAENDDSKELPSNDSAPPAGQGNDSGAKGGSNVGAPTADNPSGELPGTKKAQGKLSGDQGNSNSGSNVGAPTPSNPSGELPHSKKVRGTLSNDDGKKVNKTQLGDPASLKAETSNTNDMSKSTEREGQDKSGKSKL
jgi:hypothetical protein